MGSWGPFHPGTTGDRHETRTLTHASLLWQVAILILSPFHNPQLQNMEFTAGCAGLQGRPPSHFQKRRMRQEEEPARRNKWQGQRREGKIRRKETSDKEKGSLQNVTLQAQFCLWRCPERAHAFPPKPCHPTTSICQRSLGPHAGDVCADKDSHVYQKISQTHTFIHRHPYTRAHTLTHLHSIHTHAHMRTYVTSPIPPNSPVLVVVAVPVLPAAQRY